MKIVIVGAGAVGSYLAERLAGEGLDVVVIEADEQKAADLQERIDALVVTGNGASVATLESIGAADADLLVAVSNSDGANVLACSAAHQLGVARTVARIEDPDLREGVDRLGVDVVIDPGATAASELVALVRQTGVSEIVHFADGALVLVGGTVAPGAPLARGSLPEVQLRNAEWGWVVAATVRHGHTLVGLSSSNIRAGDHVLLMTTKEHLAKATALMGLRKRRIRRVVIMGGTRLSELTCDVMLAAGFSVIVVDSNRERCAKISARHPKAVVIFGDPIDPDVLSDLELGGTDAVLALTGWDEMNITACLVAKALGAASTIARFNRIDFVSLLSGVGIDAAVSSRLLAASAILRFIRHGRIQQVVTFSDTDAEALELEVAEGAPAIDKSLAELRIPHGVVVGGISRVDTTFVPDGSTRIREGDRIIVFAIADRVEDASELFAP